MPLQSTMWPSQRLRKAGHLSILSQCLPDGGEDFKTEAMSSFCRTSIGKPITGLGRRNKRNSQRKLVSGWGLEWEISHPHQRTLSMLLLLPSLSTFIIRPKNTCRLFHPPLFKQHFDIHCGKELWDRLSIRTDLHYSWSVPSDRLCVCLFAFFS